MYLKLNCLLYLVCFIQLSTSGPKRSRIVKPDGELLNVNVELTDDISDLDLEAVYQDITQHQDILITQPLLKAYLLSIDKMYLEHRADIMLTVQ
ncbi:uncharacterized protein LOC126844973 isoform X2 [Adelges cooleyi]|uniref:uncharacterized protein LOC126844973 isoform X2 n=1 Tax=Adelges cooleyi TaxID=133065 RepID=UPI00217F5E9F|nr:uncharacterized protein LOC126844973 isoform X2 [Adelges cooleyi]